MRVFLQSTQKKVRNVCVWVWSFLAADRTKRGAQFLSLFIASLGVTWLGWQNARIASGLYEGAVLHFLPQTLPLLFSGALYIDRFAGVFGVILSALVLLAFTEGSRGALKRGVLMGILVFGVLAASTPFTLVAWIVIVAAYYATQGAQKERLGFVMSMGAMALSVLLLSGGAFLADMTIVSSISAQLPPASILLALTLLFGGALWSIRTFEGGYALIPLYITLRLCLFFLASAPTLLLTIVAVVAVFAAVHAARTGKGGGAFRSAMYLSFMSIPLTMIAVEMQVITAVQCFLFGGLAVAAAGMIGGFSGIWPTRLAMPARVIARFFESVMPGTFMGTGAVLICAGFISLGQVAQPIEIAYLLFVGGATLVALLFLSRSLTHKEVRTSPKNISGILQVLMLALGGVFFAQMLAFLGTTIGGDVPDVKIDLVLGATTLSFIPWMILLGSAGIVALGMLIKKYAPEVWERGEKGVLRMYAWGDRRCVLPKYAQGLCAYGMHRGASINASVKKLEDRVEHMTFQERGVLILILFIVTLIVLF